MNRARYASLGLVILATATGALARTWTNTDGDTLEADFVRLRDRTVILKTDDKTIRAPLARLSEADRDWVARHKKLSRSREWGAASATPAPGKFLSVRNGKVRVQQGSQVSLVPFAELGAEDWAYLDTLYAHLGEAMPDELAAAKPKPESPSAEAAGVAGPTRDWVNTAGRKITAAFGGTRRGKVILLLKGREFAVPLKTLSKGDRAWVAKFELARLAADLRAGASDAATVFAVAASRDAGPATPPPPPTIVSGPSAQGPGQPAPAER